MGERWAIKPQQPPCDAQPPSSSSLRVCTAKTLPVLCSTQTHTPKMSFIVASLLGFGREVKSSSPLPSCCRPLSFDRELLLFVAHTRETLLEQDRIDRKGSMCSRSCRFVATSSNHPKIGCLMCGALVFLHSLAYH